MPSNVENRGSQTTISSQFPDMGNSTRNLKSSIFQNVFGQLPVSLAHPLEGKPEAGICRWLKVTHQWTLEAGTTPVIFFATAPFFGV